MTYNDEEQVQKALGTLPTWTLFLCVPTYLYTDIDIEALTANDAEDKLFDMVQTGEILIEDLDWEFINTSSLTPEWDKFNIIRCIKND